jgi:hypothetical protein
VLDNIATNADTRWLHFYGEGVFLKYGARPSSAAATPA